MYIVSRSCGVVLMIFRVNLFRCSGSVGVGMVIIVLIILRGRD